MGGGVESLMPMSLFEVLSSQTGRGDGGPVGKSLRTRADGQDVVVGIGDRADAYRFVVDIPTLLVERTAEDPGDCSSFTLPAYYEPETPAPYSRTGKVSGAWKMSTGCYAYVVHRARPPLSELIGWVASSNANPVLVR